MLRRGAGSGILMGIVLCAIGGALSALGSRHHGPGGAQAIYVGVVITGALRIGLALVPERRAIRQQRQASVSAAAAPAPEPAPSVNFEPLRSFAGQCWDCGSRVRPDAAICFHCGAAQVNGYQRATGGPAMDSPSPAPAPTPQYQGLAEPARYG